MALALFLKASFFLICFPFIALSLLFWGANIKRLAGLTAGFGAVAFAILAYMHFQLPAMISDLRMAAGARSALLTWKSPIWVTESQLAPLMLVLALIAACSYLVRDQDWKVRVQIPILGLFVYFADIGLVMTNAPGGALPLLPILALVIASRTMELRDRLPPQEARAIRPYHASLLLFCTLLLVPQFSSDLIGMGAAAWRKLHPSAENSPVRFDQPRLASLVLYNDDRALQKSANGSVYTTYVNDGVDLLKKTVRPATGFSPWICRTRSPTP